MSLTEDKSSPELDPVALEAAHIAPVDSPYAGRKLTVAEHLAISSFWFATNFLWGALLVIMLPGQIRTLAPFDRVAALSILTAIGALVPVIVPLVVGALSDRCASRFGRRRPYIAAGTLANLGGLTLMAAAYMYGEHHKVPAVSGALSLLGQPTFLLFLVAYMVVQFGNNIATAAYCGIIPDLIPADQRGAAGGYMALMSQVGTLAGAVICGKILTVAWQQYTAVGAVLVWVLLITLFGVHENPLPERPPKIHWGSYLKSLWIDPRKYPDFAWVWITRALVMLGFYSVLPFINYYLIDVVGIAKPEGDAAILTGVILLASSVTGVIGGYISDRIGRKRVVYVANSMIAVMALAFIFCRSRNEVMLAGVFFGLGFGAYTSVDWALGTDVLPSKKDAGKEMAVWHVAMTLPQTAAAFLAGGLIGVFGMTTSAPTEVGGEPVTHYAIAGYSAVFILAALCFAAGAFFLKNVRGVR
jgi:MFS family permease